MKALALGFLLFLSFPVVAEESFALGMTLNHRVSVCLDKADALEIAKTEKEQGFEAGIAVWQTKPRCANVIVSGAKVGAVVLSIPVVRDGAKTTLRVVEIKDPAGEVVAHFLTTAPLVASVEVVPFPIDPKTNRKS